MGSPLNLFRIVVFPALSRPLQTSGEQKLGYVISCLVYFGEKLTAEVSSSLSPSASSSLGRSESPFSQKNTLIFKKNYAPAELQIHWKAVKTNFPEIGKTSKPVFFVLTRPPAFPVSRILFSICKVIHNFLRRIVKRTQKPYFGWFKFTFQENLQVCHCQ